MVASDLNVNTVEVKGGVIIPHVRYSLHKVRRILRLSAECRLPVPSFYSSNTLGKTVSKTTSVNYKLDSRYLIYTVPYEYGGSLRGQFGPSSLHKNWGS